MTVAEQMHSLTTKAMATTVDVLIKANKGNVSAILLRLLLEELFAT